MSFRIASLLLASSFLLSAVQTAGSMESGGDGGGYTPNYVAPDLGERPRKIEGDRGERPRRDFAVRHHRNGGETRSTADGKGGRDVTHRGAGGTDSHKSRWNDKPWATWVDTTTGKTGSWGNPPPECGRC